MQNRASLYTRFVRNTKTLFFELGKQSKQISWLQQNQDVFKEDFNNLWVITRLFSFNEWREIANALEAHFSVKFIFNPLCAKKALIRTDHEKIEDLIEAPGKWQTFGQFHLLVEKWKNVAPEP